MPKFYGNIGYGVTAESFVGSGVWVDEVVELPYYGDILRNISKVDDGESLNDDISVSNSISIVADEYANQNFSSIRYIQWAGALWTVTSVEVKSPRLLLSLGKVYNGPVPIPEAP
jgi:hypothetical protein